jgi:hypothetical protein
MASSTESGLEPAPEAPREELLGTIAAQTAAIDELIGRARKSIAVFDLDLSETGWTSAARSERLARFLRASRHARIDIIVHDLRYIERRCARLCELLRRFGSQVTIRRTGPAARAATDPLVIVDGRHFLHRFHIEQPRALLGLDSPHAATPLVQRFEAIWATGDDGLTGTVLGL